LLATLIAKKDWAGAIPAGRRAVELAPTNPAGYVNLSLALHMSGQVPAARAVLTDAMTKLPAVAADSRTLLRYNAACASTRLGDHPAAYDGLVADLAGWARLLADDPVRNARDLRRQVGNWLTDEDLVSVRDPKALADLPAADRARWERFWTDVR